jgi:hypothetical protein
MFIKTTGTKNLNYFSFLNNPNIKINSKLQTFSTFSFLSKKYFFTPPDTQKEDLAKLKSSLSQERKGMLNRISDYLNFNKVSVVNHTKRDLDTKEMESEINNFKKADKELQEKHLKEDLQKLEEIFKYLTYMMSGSKFTEDTIDKLLEKIKELKSIENLFKDKRYNMLKEDILFMLNNGHEPKVIAKLLNFAFIFFKQDQYAKGKSFKDYSEHLGQKVWGILEYSEIEELLTFVNFFHSTKDVDPESFARLSEPFRNEIFRRLEKEYYLSLKMKNPYIENDEIVKVLFSFQESNLLDDTLVEKIFSYIPENIETFGMKDLIEICLFFADKKEYSKIFLPFFDKINEMKLKRNLKVMSVEVLYDYLYLYNRITTFLTSVGKYEILPVLEKITELLLKNDSINKELTNYHLFMKTSTKLITKFSIFIENLYSNIIQENKEQQNEKNTTKTLDENIKKILSLTTEYFITNLKFFSTDDTISLINMLSSKKLIDSEILNTMTSNFISNLRKMDDSNFLKLINFYIKNTNLTIGPKFLKELKNIYQETSNIKVSIEVLFLFIRRRLDDLINQENFDVIQNKYIAVKSLSTEEKFNQILNVQTLICLLWCLSYFSVLKNSNQNSNFNFKENFLNDILFRIKSNLINNSPNINEKNSHINIYELILFIHACRNFSSPNSNKKLDNQFQEKLNEGLILLENDIIKNLNNFSMLEFLTIFSVYTDRRIGSDELITNFQEIIIRSVEQFGLIHLDVLIKGLESIRDYKKNLIKENVEKIKNVEINEGQGKSDHASNMSVTQSERDDDKSLIDTFALIEVLNHLKIKLELKNLEKSVEDISDDMIKESIREFIKKEKNREIKEKTVVYKKLI